MLATYAYLCDLKQCQDCTFPECSHTTDIRHRLTKEGCKLTEMKLVGSENGVNHYMEYFVDDVGLMRSWSVNKNDLA